MTVFYSNTTLREQKERVKREYGTDLLDSGGSGNQLFTLVKCRDGINRIITHIFRVSGTEVGHKCVGSESCFPYYFNCPARLLNKSTDMTEMAIEWRTRCLALQKTIKLIKDYYKTLNSGDVVQYTSNKQAIFIKPHSNTFFVGQLVGDDKLYLMRIADIVPPKIEV